MRRSVFVSAILLLVVGDTAAQSPQAIVGTISLASATGAATPGSGHASGPALSRDGRYVAFSSETSDLVPGDTNGVADVFVRDRRTWALVRVSLDTDGLEATCGNTHPALSGDGRFVAFVSCAPNLVHDDTNARVDVFLRDRDTDQDGQFDEPGAVATIRVSVASDGTQGDRDSSASTPALSGDGRYVVFDSAAATLVPTDTNQHTDIFVRDRELGTTTRLSLAPDGTEGNGESLLPSVSADGRFVAFTSGASNLVPGDTNTCSFPSPGSNCYDVFVRDRDVDADDVFDEPGDVGTDLVSVTSDGTPGNDMSGVAAISGDGCFVAFHSWAPNLCRDCVALHDRATHETVQAGWIGVSVGSDYAYGLSAVRVGISGDGALLVFNSWVSLPDGNKTPDVLAFERGGIGRPAQRFDPVRPPSGLGPPANGASSAPVVSDTGREIAFLSDASDLVQTDRNGHRDVFLFARDADMDGLLDSWERQFGLDATVAGGDDGSDGDPDHDGRPNAGEFLAGTHPRGFFTLHLAEGGQTAFFSTVVALLNVSDTAAAANVRLLRPHGEPIARGQPVAPHSSAFGLVQGMSPDSATEYSIQVESDVRLVASRTMQWDLRDGFGAHAAGAVDAPSLVWYFAEGATHWRFDLFYLLENPNDTVADVEITFLRPQGAPIVTRHALAPLSRSTIWVDTIPGLENTDVAGIVRVLNGRPIVAERAMYLSRPDQLFTAGHASAGVPAPSARWFLADGATGDFFDTFILVANTNAEDASVRVTYFLPDGTMLTKHHVVAGASRHNIWVDLEDPALANTAVSALVESVNDVPIVVERSMWWPGPTCETWYEAHNSPGAVAPGILWTIAGGEVGMRWATETYLLVLNTADHEALARITLYFVDGTTAEKLVAIGPRRRLNVPVGALEAGFGVIAWNRHFGAAIESLGNDPAPLVVERSMYWNPQDVPWGAGTNVSAVRLR